MTEQTTEFVTEFAAEATTEFFSEPITEMAAEIAQNPSSHGIVDQIKDSVHVFAENIVNFVGIPTIYADYLYVLLISMLPIIELRGAIPVAAVMQLNPIISYIVSIVGNMLPVPFILLFITRFCELMKKVKYLNKLPLWLEKKVAKNEGKITKYKNWGLFIFVAIPLPGTGAWTGALVAAFLGYKFKDAIFSILAGVLAAGVIMTAGSFGLVEFITGLFS